MCCKLSAGNSTPSAEPSTSTQPRAVAASKGARTVSEHLDSFRLLLLSHLNVLTLTWLIRIVRAMRQCICLGQWYPWATGHWSSRHIQGSSGAHIGGVPRAGVPGRDRRRGSGRKLHGGCHKGQLLAACPCHDERLMNCALCLVLLSGWPGVLVRACRI